MTSQTELTAAGPGMVTNQDTESAPAVGTGGVPKGAKTSDYYRIQKIPGRFDNPGNSYNPGNPVFTCTESFPTPTPRQPDPDEWFEGYGTKPNHPMYRTTSSTYGSQVPTVHTMPTCFHCKSQKFSEKLGKCGMYRNHSLNTGEDHSIV